jgi:protein-disulfide isomerase
MRLTRRSLVAASALAPASAPALAPTLAQAQAADPRLTPRGTGQANAPVTVTEFFSLTCSHCANFHNSVWPRVKTELVETGRIRMVWRDFPLDQVALQAAMVARALPPERYDAFLSTLFQTQDRWAFAQGRQMEELARIAALAGMDRATFDTVINDQAFGRAILEQRLAAEREYSIRATPSFLFGKKLHTGGLSFEQFQRQAQDAERA